jgi:hypothetical protein
MEFDDLQRAWQSQTPPPFVTIDARLLLKEVRRNQQQFRATIFWRDVREVGVAVLLVLYFSWRHHNWTDYLSALACAGVGAFMVIDRMRQRQTSPAFNDPLKNCLEASLAQVNHQIWLLRNVLWWYLLPLTIASAISMTNTSLHARHFDVAGAITSVVVAVLIFWGVYRLNQLAVRKSLEPRREELHALIASLQPRPETK